LNMTAAPSCSKRNFVVMDSGLDASHRPGMTTVGFRARAKWRAPE
jgi:hypothetical protein